MQPAAEVVIRRIVRRDQPGPRAAFDGHVADRHLVLHREIPDHLTRVLNAVAHAATGRDLSDEIKNDILRRDARSQLAVDAEFKRLWPRLQQRLRRHHVFDFAGANSERERAERAVRRGMAVAADDRHARLRVALFRTDDVDNALANIVNVVQRDAELFAIGAERVDLLLRDRIQNRQAAIGGRNVVVDGRERPLRPANFAAREAQSLKRLRARHFMHQVQIDIENRLPARLFEHDMIVPDILKQRARLHQDLPNQWNTESTPTGRAPKRLGSVGTCSARTR